MSSRKLQFTPTARGELRRIFRYSRRVWGADQAQRYRATLDEAFARITMYPATGTPLPEYGGDVRRLTVAEHCIFYETLPDSVRVVRITQVRMADPPLDFS